MDTQPPAVAEASFSVPDGSVTVGTLLSTTFAVWRQNLAPFTLVALLFQLPVSALNWLAGSPFLEHHARFGTVTPEAQAFVMTGRYWAVTCVAIALFFLETGALCAGALAHLQGARVSARAMVAAALPRAIPLLAVNLLATLAVTMGLALVVIPGIVVAVMYGLIDAVLMAEPISAWKALGRSRALTKGYRAKLFAVFVIGYVVVVAPNLLVGRLAPDVPYLAFFLTSLTGAVFGTLLLAVPAVAYYELRRLKDGAGTAELARVFE